MEKLDKRFAWFLDALEFAKKSKEESPKNKIDAIQLINDLKKIESMPDDVFNSEVADLKGLQFIERIKTIGA